MTGDHPPALSRFELTAAELRSLGITVTRLPGEYRVNYRTGTDATARTVETLDQALELGRTMTADAPTPPSPAHGKQGHRPLRMMPKAVRRRMIRQHIQKTHACARSAGSARKNRNLLTGRRQGAGQFGTTHIKADYGLQAIQGICIALVGLLIVTLLFSHCRFVNR
jgi:hypothetical protein